MCRNSVNYLLIGVSVVLVSVIGVLWYLHEEKMQTIREAATVVRESFGANTFVGGNLDEKVDLNSATTREVEDVIPAIDEDEAIVKKKNLSVPFASQAPELNWDQPWQDACEEAAIVMLQAYYGEYSLNASTSKDMILKILDREAELGWGDSIEIEKIKQLAEEFVGQKFRIRENPTAEDLRGYIRAGKPILVVAYGKILPNPFFKNGGPEYHALIVRGFTADGFLTNDPGTRFGENLFYRDGDLMKSIHDWNDGDVAGGTPAVLVAE